MKPQSNLNDCDVPFNNARLQFARKYRRHTIRSLARISGIAVRTISSYENGSGAPPSSPTLNALATALELPVSFFFAEDQEDFSKEQVSFRAPSKMTALDRDQHLCLASLIYELTQKIGVLFKLPVVNLPIFESLLYPESTNSIPDAVIESQADALRLKWGLGIEPISNLLNAVELNGIMIYSLPPSISSADGFSFWRGGRPFIIYNPNKTSERSRFDIAHELGHLVLHGNDSKISDSKTREREANTFASAFLMPKSGILSKLPHQCTISNLIPYKRKWKVSLAAFNVRLHHHDRAGIVCDMMGNEDAHHAGISGAGGFHERDLLDSRISHRIQNAALIRVRPEPSWLCAGIGGKIGVLVRPLRQAHRRPPADGRQAFAEHGADGGGDGNHYFAGSHLPRSSRTARNSSVRNSRPAGVRPGYRDSSFTGRPASD